MKLDRHVFTCVLMMATALPALAGNDDTTYLAQQHLRCAAFYLDGAEQVKRPDLKRKLENLAGQSILQAELLSNKEKPWVKAEFDAARKRFGDESQREESKADRSGFVNHMARYCAGLHSQPASATKAP